MLDIKLISKVLLQIQEGKLLYFFCPACKCNHPVSIAPGGWSYNQNPDVPTFSPSFGTRGHDIGYCHLFIEEGMIRYLSDSTHELKDQIVPMVPYPQSEIDKFFTSKE